MFALVQNKITKLFMAATFLCASSIPSISAQPTQLSLLEENKSYRSTLNAQPNIEKGEVVLPQEASMIYVIDQSLTGFLSQVASINQLKLTMTEQVSGTIKKVSLPMKLENVMIELTKLYGLEWHLKNDHLFVSNSLENTNRLINLGSLTLSKFNMALKSAGIKSGANVVTFKEVTNEILIIGSKEYINKVLGIVKSYQSNDSSQNNN